MAKARTRRARDTWKEKKWYKINTPKGFDEKYIGETPAKSPESLIGRRVEATMRELSGEFNKQYVKLKFEISGVAGDTAITKFISHEVTSDYIRSMIRRGTTRIDTPVSVETKEGYYLRVHILAITVRRSKSSQEKFMRETIEKLITEIAEDRTLEQFIELVVTGRLASEVYHKAKKIYPLKRVETISTKVLEEPEE